MASRTSRREGVRGLPWAFGVGRYDRKQIHSVSERSVGYGFLIGESVQNHLNPHLYQTGSKLFSFSVSHYTKQHPLLCGYFWMNLRNPSSISSGEVRGKGAETLAGSCRAVSTPDEGGPAVHSHTNAASLILRSIL